MDIFDASFKGVRRLQMYLAHVGYCLPDLQMDEQLIDFSHDPSDEAAARIIDACHVYRPDLFYGKVFFIKPSFDSLLQGKESQVYEISQVSRLAKDQYIKIGQMPYQIQNVLVHTTDWITSWYYRPLEDEVKNDRFTHRRDREGSNSVHSGFGDQLFDNPHSPGGEFNSPNKNQIPGQTGYGQSSSTSSSSSSQSEGYNEFSRYNEEEEQQSREFTPPPSSLPTTSASIDELIKSEIEKQNQKYKEKDKQKEKQKKNEKDQQKDKDRNKQIKLKDKNKEKEPINKKKKEIDKNKKKKNLKKDSKESSETDSPISSSQPSDSTTDHNDNDNINDNDNDRAPLSQIPESRLLEDDDYEDEEEDMHGAGFDEDNFLLQDDDDDDNDLNHSSENRKKGGADDSNQKKGKKVIVNADAQDDAEDNVYKFDFDKELQLQREQEKLKDAIGKKKKKKKKKKKITSASAEELEKQKKEQEAQFKIREHKLKEKRWRQEQHRAVRERKQQQKLKKDQELQEKMRIREAEVLAEAERNDQEELIMMGTVQDSELGKPERYEGLFNEGTFFVTTIFYVMLIFSFVFAVITAYNAFKLPIRNSPYQTMIVTSYGGYISPVPDTQPVEEPASDPAQETAYQQNDNKNMHNSIHFTSNSTKHNNNKNNLNLNHNSKPKNNSHSFITVDNQIRVINEEGDELLPEEVLDEEQEDQMKQKDSDLDKLCEFFNSYAFIMVAFLFSVTLILWSLTLIFSFLALHNEQYSFAMNLMRQTTFIVVYYSIPENASEEEFETFAKSFGPVKEIIHQPRNSEYLRSAEVEYENEQSYKDVMKSSTHRRTLQGKIIKINQDLSTIINSASFKPPQQPIQFQVPISYQLQHKSNLAVQQPQQQNQKSPLTYDEHIQALEEKQFSNNSQNQSKILKNLNNFDGQNTSKQDIEKQFSNNNNFHEREPKQIQQINLTQPLLPLPPFPTNQIQSSNQKSSFIQGQQQIQYNSQNQFPERINAKIITSQIQSNLPNPQSSTFQSNQLSNTLNQNLTLIQVLKSESLNEQEKNFQLEKLYYQYLKMNDDELSVMFTSHTYNYIQKSLGNLQTNSELTLLNIIELIADRGLTQSKFPNFDTHTWKTQVFKQMKKSGLIYKIEQLIIQRAAEEEKIFDKLIFSSLTSQIIRIYMLLMNKIDIKVEMLDKCAKVIQNNIQSLIKDMNNNIKGQIQEQDNYEYEQLTISNIKSMINALQALILTSNIDENEDYLINQINIHKSIFQLIQFTCSPNYNQQLKINIMNSPSLKQLIFSTFEILDQFSSENSAVKKYLQTENNIFIHLLLFLKVFAFPYPHHNQQFKIEQQNQLYPEPTMIFATLIQINKIFCDKYSKQKISHITIDYIPTLIKLINYKNDNYFKQNRVKEITNINQQCIDYMSEIYSISGLQIYMQLSDIGYSGALTVALCIAGGRGIQDSSIVHGVLVKLNKFYAEILIRKQLQLSVNMNLHQQQNEQIESEGGHEEIEALLFNSFVFGVQDIMSQAIMIKNIISNIFCNNMVQINDW